MKVIEVTKFGGPDVLALAERPKPRCRSGEVQIEVMAIGVNQLDRRQRAGLAGTELKPPFVPGQDVAGVVSAVGKGGSRFTRGDKVFALRQSDRAALGTYAEFVTVPEEQVAAKPINLSFAAAASIPTPALAAWQALRERAGVHRGDRVLIHGAAGGVGSFAVQFAHLAGAWVLATASEANADWVLDIGADEVIDYQKVDFADVLQRRFPAGIDVVLDTIGGDTLRRSLKLLGSNGRLITLADPEAASQLAESGVQPEYMQVRADGEQLEKIAALFDENILQTTLAAAMPFSEFRAAHELLDSNPGRGRIVLTLD